eukprot:7380187-Prymnesium_polylepis.2
MSSELTADVSSAAMARITSVAAFGKRTSNSERVLTRSAHDTSACAARRFAASEWMHHAAAGRTAWPV